MRTVTPADTSPTCVLFLYVIIYVVCNGVSTLSHCVCVLALCPVYLVGIPHELETRLKLRQVPVGDHILLRVGHPHTNLRLRGGGGSERERGRRGEKVKGKR